MLFFDSLTHPTVNNHSADIDTSFDVVKNQMSAYGFKWALAVGLAGENGYNHELFIKECLKHDCFIPIAGIDPKTDEKALEKEIDHIKELGFKGIKIHPRLAGIDWGYKTLPVILDLASKKGLVILLCSYMHRKITNGNYNDPFISLVNLLSSSPEAKVVLLHGGDVRLLQYAEFVRHNQNLLLDLSFTILKYKGSSIDLDLKFLFEQFDRRICIGTDHPSYSHKDLVERVKELSLGISQIKLENIFYKNLLEFLGIKKGLLNEKK